MQSEVGRGWMNTNKQLSDHNDSDNKSFWRVRLPFFYYCHFVIYAISHLEIQHLICIISKQREYDTLPNELYVFVSLVGFEKNRFKILLLSFSIPRSSRYQPAGCHIRHIYVYLERNKCDIKVRRLTMRYQYVFIIQMLSYFTL